MHPLAGAAVGHAHIIGLNEEQVLAKVSRRSGGNLAVHTY